MGHIQFNGTQEEWDALVKRNKQITMEQQTGVDWLVKEFGLEDFKATIMLAKAKEKEHIAKAWDAGNHQYFSSNEDFDNGEEYYEENYKNK